MLHFRGREFSLFEATVTTVCVAWSSFQLYTAATGVLPALQQRSVHLMFALFLVFLIYPFNPTRDDLKHRFSFEKVGLALISIIPVAYVAINYHDLWTQTNAATSFQTVLGLTLILLILEAARRSIGWAIPGIGVAFLGYAYFGDYFPFIISHRGYSLGEIALYQALSLQGVFGVALGVVATFIFLFILYAALLNVSGAGQLFIVIATRLFGGVRGGPAKIGIVASALFGSISGSAVANVAGTGNFTIPLMKKLGYSGRFAGAVEAVASSGGQFMPPLMGASAFLIAEVLAVPFWEVALAATVPAVLYYLALFFMVDLEAAKKGIKGVSKDEMPAVRPALAQSWHLLVSPVVLVYLLLFLQWSPMSAAFWTIIITLIAMVINPKNRVSISQVIEIMRQGALGTLEVTVACASVGMVVGVILQTGLGYQLSSLLIGASGGSLLALLFLTMCASLILGMGLPTVAAYLVLSVTVAPALIELGVNALAAHLFIFYFGIISAITPPVALASLVAAGIAQEKMWPTSITAFRLGIAAFILPFMFAYNPALILQGGITEIVLGIGSAVLGIFALSVGLQRYFLAPLGVWSSCVAVVGALLLIVPEQRTDLLGMGIIVLLGIILWGIRHKSGSRSGEPGEHCIIREPQMKTGEQRGN
ncbi:TRAP transporter permease [Marinobacter caseinilyticus]|uniref:TRAP transporter permease n=1 Tax=Marinobacter caseinilyticus TaxID=2692195 RepID=UPI001409697D|nr:TRAP transporter permease [Marinobacter caseinilyticus]